MYIVGSLEIPITVVLMVYLLQVRSRARDILKVQLDDFRARRAAGE
jgi:hypothetical protein